MVAIPDPERKVDVEKVGGLPWYPLQSSSTWLPSSLSSTFISLDLLQLYEGLREKLPAYARPIFVRLVNKIDVTGKHSRPYLLIMHETRKSNMIWQIWYYQPLLIEESVNNLCYFQPLLSRQYDIFSHLQTEETGSSEWRLQPRTGETQILLFLANAKYNIQNVKCKNSKNSSYSTCKCKIHNTKWKMKNAKNANVTFSSSSTCNRWERAPSTCSTQSSNATNPSPRFKMFKCSNVQNGLMFTMFKMISSSLTWSTLEIHFFEKITSRTNELTSWYCLLQEQYNNIINGNMRF